MDKQVIEAWLQALSGEACGPDLEYDPTFMELAQAAAGKPETQFGPAEPPSWPSAREIAEQLFGQTRDLRVALLWGRAVVNLEGLEALPAALQLLHGLLDNFWDELHPRPDPDDGDTFARVSVLSSLDSLEGGLLGDIRQAPLIKDRRLAGLRMRDVEIALERLAPRADETPPTAGQISGMLGDAPDLSERLQRSTDEALQALKALQTLMNERFGIGEAVEVKNLRGMLTGLQSLLPVSAGAEAPSADENHDESVPAPRRGGGAGLGAIETRQDAVRAIQAVCAYLERTEPTNPAQLLLRRAERLIDKNFLQLVRDLAPDAVNEVARVLGVDPDSLGDSGSY
jgi:type VI secretion system protein ImpA